MNNLNKITHTRVGDNIHYFQNGQEARGVIVKMSNAYVSVLKDSGVIDEIHINDTFFVKDIITNKTWNDMNLEERVVELQKAHAFSPRFISKTWEELPKELQEVLTKSNLEESTHGQIGGNRAGVSTKTPFDAEEDYEGESDDRDKQTKEEFKHEHQEKPKVEKNNGMEQEAKKKVQNDGMRQDWRPTGGESDKNKNYIKKYSQGGSKYSNSPSVGGGDYVKLPEPEKKLPSGNAPTKTPRDAPRVDEKDETTGGKFTSGGKRKIWKAWLSLTQKGHNPFKVKAGFGKKTLNDRLASRPNPEVGKLIAAGHEKKRQDKVTRDKKIYEPLGTDSTDKFKALKSWLEAKKMGAITHRDGTVTSFDDKYDDSVNAGFKSHKEQYDKDPKSKPHSFDPSKSPRFDAKTGKYIGEPPHKSDLKHHASVRDHLESKQREAWRNFKQVKNKEGDGAGNSGINSTDTIGVYNARYSDKKGRYRDQGKDGKQ